MSQVCLPVVIICSELSYIHDIRSIGSHTEFLGELVAIDCLPVAGTGTLVLEAESEVHLGGEAVWWHGGIGMCVCDCFVCMLLLWFESVCLSVRKTRENFELNFLQIDGGGGKQQVSGSA